jgi:hypothetical protein
MIESRSSTTLEAEEFTLSKVTSRAGRKNLDPHWHIAIDGGPREVVLGGFSARQLLQHRVGARQRRGDASDANRANESQAWAF